MDQQADSQPGILTTTINRRWFFKMLVFLAGLFILGVWGTADALWLYPTRGRHHIEFSQRDYLDALAKEGVLVRDASVTDPAAELSRLQSQTPAAGSSGATKLIWLESLSRLNDLDALARENKAAIEAHAAAGKIGSPDTKTMFSDPRAALDKLNTDLANRNLPKPLAAYDIPLQYFFMALGFGGTLWMIFFLARTSRVKFKYDPAAKRLFLPDGRSFVPAEISEVDKRDWHKYYMYMTVKGFDSELKLDLLRYAPLEEWALEMEKLHPNYEPPEEPAQSGEAEEAAAASEPGAGDQAR